MEMSPLGLWSAAIVVGIILPLLEAGSNLQHLVFKRMLPDSQSCDPSKGTCFKGDFVDKSIADCKYEKALSTCTASGKTGGIISWVVAPDKNNRCKPIESGKQFSCGAKGTNTRCVCSDYKIKFNECRCQYWTDDTPGSHDPAFCTAYYLAGSTQVHHYACCNNCNNDTSTSAAAHQDLCDSHTYEGGSTAEYCDSCGVSTGGGLVKYYFNCGSCQTQTQCEAVCNHTTGLRLPGFCWKWVNCFKGCCVAAMKAMAEKDHQRSRSELKKRYSEADYGVTTSMEFCGDGHCSESEDHLSCPADCCYLINKDCSNVPSECTSDCCQQDSCCLNKN